MFKRIRAAKLFGAGGSTSTSERETPPNPTSQPRLRSSPASAPVPALVQRQPQPAVQQPAPQPAPQAAAPHWRHRPPPVHYFSSGDSSSTDSSTDAETRRERRRRRRPPPRYVPPPALERPSGIRVPERLDYLVPDLVRYCNIRQHESCPSDHPAHQCESQPAEDQPDQAHEGRDMGQRASAAACTHQQRQHQLEQRARQQLAANGVNQATINQTTNKQSGRSGVSLSWALGAPCRDISKPLSNKYQDKNQTNTIWNDRLNNRQQNDKTKIKNQTARKALIFPISNANALRNGPFKCKSDQERNNKNERRSNEQRRRANQNQYALQESRAISEPALREQPGCGSDGTDSGKKPMKHRRRRERPKTPGFGYQIRDINDFLTNACLDNPANIPVVLGCPSVLYRTRPGGYQQEVQLPLGMVVNAVFKNRGWLYVQTPHAEEGYISHGSCLPLGILPTEQSRTDAVRGKSPPCWESTGDIFPRPCGNLTDSEKEQLRGGTRSECGATRPRQRTKRSRRDTRSLCRGSAGEGSVDRLFLQAAGTTEYALNGSKVAQTCKTKMKTEENEIKCLRHTLLAVCEEYTDIRNDLIVNKGDVVILVTTVRARDGEQWFHIRDRDGKEGLIPAQVAGNGFL